MRETRLAERGRFELTVLLLQAAIVGQHSPIVGRSYRQWMCSSCVVVLSMLAHSILSTDCSVANSCKYNCDYKL